MGLYHFRQRDYSVTLGRCLERDPWEFEAGDRNFYRYEGNGPTFRLDPSGLEFNLLRDIPAQRSTGPSAVDQVERTLARRSQILAQGGTPPPLMAGSSPVYGNGNQTAMEAMHDAGHLIVKMTAQALEAPLMFTPAAPYLMAGHGLYDLSQGDYLGAAMNLVPLVPEALKRLPCPRGLNEAGKNAPRGKWALGNKGKPQGERIKIRKSLRRKD